MVLVVVVVVVAAVVVVLLYLFVKIRQLGKRRRCKTEIGYTRLLRSKCDRLYDRDSSIDTSILLIEVSGTTSPSRPAFTQFLARLAQEGF